MDASTWQFGPKVLNQKKNGKIGNESFEAKKEHFRDSPYPLTNQISKYNEWNVSSLIRNHEELISLAAKVFVLV